MSEELRAKYAELQAKYEELELRLRMMHGNMIEPETRALVNIVTDLIEIQKEQLR